MQQPIIMSSDREGKEVLWGSTGGQESQTTSTVRKRATIFVADLVSQCASLVASSKAAVYPKTLPGINEIKKDFLQVSVECELLVCACLDLHKELLHIQPHSDVACLGELGLDPVDRRNKCATFWRCLPLSSTQQHCRQPTLPKSAAELGRASTRTRTRRTFTRQQI